MNAVAGVDGCRSGWICVLQTTETPHRESVFTAKTIDEIIHHECKPKVIAIDIPIGFPERVIGRGRDCDGLVRQILGKRASSVFPVPARDVVAQTDYRQACAVSIAMSDPPKRISKQIFYLFPKMREVDGVMTPGLQNRIYECHPEAAFWAMNDNKPVVEPKKIKGRLHLPGLELRRTLLQTQGFNKEFLRQTKFDQSDARCDDFLDACACCWTAARIEKGGALRFPVHPPRDRKGLRMEILA